MHQVTELRQRKAALVNDIKDIQRNASNGALSSDELRSIEKVETEVNNLEREIGIAERQEKRELELAQTEGRQITGQPVHSDLSRYSVVRALKFALSTALNARFTKSSHVRSLRLRVVC